MESIKVYVDEENTATGDGSSHQTRCSIPNFYASGANLEIVITDILSILPVTTHSKVECYEDTITAAVGIHTHGRRNLLIRPSMVTTEGQHPGEMFKFNTKDEINGKCVIVEMESDGLFKRLEFARYIVEGERTDITAKNGGGEIFIGRSLRGGLLPLTEAFYLKYEIKRIE